MRLFHVKRRSAPPVGAARWELSRELAKAYGVPPWLIDPSIPRSRANRLRVWLMKPIWRRRPLRAPRDRW